MAQNFLRVKIFKDFCLALKMLSLVLHRHLETLVKLQKFYHEHLLPKEEIFIPWLYTNVCYETFEEEISYIFNLSTEV